MKTKEKYNDLWTSARYQILGLLNKASTLQSVQLNPSEFENVGNRKIYAFNLEFKNGVVNNNIDGSAVARVLARVLLKSNEVLKILKTGTYKIRMDKSFCLWIKRM